ncbi:uncharacterized protein LOC143133903 [Alosa pseudoharengus]|uniref:uncharacterized protein LOC143133903 n=1 Tax=Alosa pseudoharengus TaxID=34774 RepID=UPI003F886262
MSSPMSNLVDVHGQIASILEVLANAAVSEICKVVDDGYAVLRLEISKSQNEIDSLKKKLHMTKLRCRRVCSERHGAQGYGLGRLSSPAGVHMRGKTFHSIQSFQNSNSIPEVEHGSVSQNQDTSQKRPLHRNQNTHGQQQLTGASKELATVKTEDNTADYTTSCLSRENVVTDDYNEGCVNSSEEVRTEETRPLQKSDSDKTSHPHPQAHTLKHNREAERQTEDDSQFRTWQEAGQLLEDPLAWAQEQRKSGANTNIPNADVDHGTFSRNKGTSESATNCLLSAGSIDWEPDLVLVDSVPIKVETDMTSDWNISEHGNMISNSTSGSNITCPPLNHRGEMPTTSPCHLTQAHQANQAERSQQLGRASLGNTGNAPFRCISCGKVFFQMAHLKRHERVHTGEKPFGCVRCGKRFSHRHQLTNHVRVHTGEKPFRCIHCGRHFTQSSHMKRHLSIHTGQTRSHSCAGCGRWYTTQGSLIRHQRSGCSFGN